MKVYAVIVERDGHTVKAPGVSETEIKREQHLFAAANIEQVWAAVEALRMDPEANFIGIYEKEPSIQVLTQSDAAAERSQEKK